jgi:hypothetical protein
MNKFNELYEEEFEKVNEAYLDPNELPVATTGKQNLKTGKNKFGNVFEDGFTDKYGGVVLILSKNAGWDGKVKGPKFIMISGAGTAKGYDKMLKEKNALYLSIQGRKNFNTTYRIESVHDHDLKDKSVMHKTIKELYDHVIQMYGVNSMPSYVFK